MRLTHVIVTDTASAFFSWCHNHPSAPVVGLVLIIEGGESQGTVYGACERCTKEKNQWSD